MEKNTSFIKEAYTELVEKTTWPKWDDLYSNTVTVASSSVLIALVIFAADKFFEFSVDSYFGLF